MFAPARCRARDGLQGAREELPGGEETPCRHNTSTSLRTQSEQQPRFIRHILLVSVGDTNQRSGHFNQGHETLDSKA